MPTLNNIKHEIFCQNIISGLNQTEAYLKAGYKCSEVNARKYASRLMTNEDILKRIDALKKQIEEKFEVSRLAILKEFAKIAFFDPRSLFNPDGKIKRIDELDDETAAMIVGLEVETIFSGKGKDRKPIGTLTKLKLADKIKALDSLARTKGMYNDKMNLDMTSHDESVKRIRAKIASRLAAKVG